MGTLGASLVRVAPGAVDIALSPGPSISQQHGFVHAGAVAAIADTAASYAALSLMPPGAGVLTTEFKINLVAPALGERILAWPRRQGRADAHPGADRCRRRTRRQGDARCPSHRDPDERGRPGRCRRLKPLPPRVFISA
jgi:uncharacterized protein (TIGR00369 family)